MDEVVDPNTEAQQAYNRLAAVANGRTIEPFAAYAPAWRNGSVSCFASDSADQPSSCVSKGKNNFIFCGFRSRIFQGVTFTGSNNVVFVGPYCNLTKGVVHVSGDNGIVFVGAFTQTVWAQIQLYGSNGLIFVGEGCHLGDRVVVSNSDAHGIYSAVDGSRVNTDRDIHIGDHVYVGFESRVGKGVTIENGAVVLERSVVSGVLRGRCLYQGVPATLRASDVEWCAEAIENETLEAMQKRKAERLQDHLAMLAAHAGRQSEALG